MKTSATISRAFAILVAAGGLCAVSTPAEAAIRGQTFDAASRHWAFQPLQNQPVPKVAAQARVQSPIDAFLLARLESQGVGFAPPADKRTLLRRVFYTLIGLPPTFEEITAFEADTSDRALERVVDRLLASPQYGERWARHWLDVARYADTKDLVLLYGQDAVRPYAYTYRDYVVRALNEDIPYNQFVRDQLAADLVQPALPAWRLGAVGFLTLGRLFDNNIHDQIDDQIDTVSRGLLGLTVACARCHDHKYDAITMADYYGLYGVFASSEQPYMPPLIQDPAEVAGGREFEERLGKARKELEDHIDAEFAKLTELLRLRIGDYLVRAVTTQPDLWETTQFGLSLTHEDFRPTLMLRTRRYVEQHATPQDPVFGPMAVLLALPETAFEPGRTSDAVRRALTERRSSAWNPLIVSALESASLTNRASIAQTYGAVLKSVYEASKKSTPPGAELTEAQRPLLAVMTGPDGPLWFPRRNTPDHMSRPDKDKYGGLVLALDKLAAHATSAPPARAMILADLPEPYSPRIFQRGNPSRPGAEVPRGFLRVLNGGQEKPFHQGSGRLELAESIVDPKNPLAARVFVNRVWMHYFGEPLAPSTADFGARSEPPTHPELLDWLAFQFVRDGWSIKSLHRLLILSSAFQQASASTPAVAAKAQAADPDNHLLWHYPRRRLELEAMRDTFLQVSGRLDPSMGGRPVDVAGDPANRRRTLYGLVDRQNLPGLFRAFDFATPDQCAERRPKTTVPQQALFALNAPFVQEQARALVELPAVKQETDPARRVDALVRRVLGRHPTPDETERAVRFVSAAGADTTWDAWQQFAQVLLATNELVFLD